MILKKVSNEELFMHQQSNTKKQMYLFWYKRRLQKAILL